MSTECHLSLARTLHERWAVRPYRNDDLFVFIGESITALLFTSACLETNDLLISLITSLWAAEMDGLNKEANTQTGCLCSYVSVLHHHAHIRYINAKFFIRMSYKYDSWIQRWEKKKH